MIAEAWVGKSPLEKESELLARLQGVQHHYLFFISLNRR
jgi:hypothetical protein